DPAPVLRGRAHRLGRHHGAGRHDADRHRVEHAPDPRVPREGHHARQRGAAARPAPPPRERWRMSDVRLGIDVGGTFTDVYCEAVAAAEVRIAKVLTASVQQGGLPHGLEASGMDVRRCRDLVYSTTLATNAILERKLGACALVTTRGFRDVIELGR